MYTLALDLGGTEIKLALINDEANIIIQDSVKTQNKENPEIISKRIKELYLSLLNKSLIDEKEIKGCGISCPGLLDSNAGIVIFSNNFSWFNIPFSKILSKEINKPCRIINDAEAALLGEVKFGGAIGAKNVVLLTLGTGIGSGILVNGALLSHKGAGVAGHMTIVKDGEKCTCGKRGCLESYASVTALVKNAKNLIKENKAKVLHSLINGEVERINGKVIFEALKEKDKDIEILLDEYTTYLSLGISNLVEIFRPEVVLLGGGISKVGNILTDKIEEKVKKNTFGSPYVLPPSIKTATLFNDAGLLGASSLFL